MSIWNKVLLGFIFLTAVAAIFLGYRVMKTQSYWRTSVQKHHEAIDRTTAEADRLFNGTETGGEVAEPGIRQVSVDLHSLQFRRGRVWRNCTPGNVSVSQGTTEQVNGVTAPATIVKIPVTTEDPANGIVNGSILFALTEGTLEEGGRYLGMFTVDSSGPTITLRARRLLRQEEIDQLTQTVQSGTPWVLLDTLPIEDPSLFADMSEEEMAKLLPESMVAEYVDYFKQMEGETKPEDLTLHDYGTYFTEMHRIRSELLGQIDALTADLAALQLANTQSQQQETYRLAEIERLKLEITDKQNELTAVTTHRDALQDRIQELQGQIKDTMDRNRQMASELERIQTLIISSVNQETADLTESVN